MTVSQTIWLVGSVIMVGLMAVSIHFNNKANGLRQVGDETGYKQNMSRAWYALVAVGSVLTVTSLVSNIKPH